MSLDHDFGASPAQAGIDAAPARIAEPSPHRLPDDADLRWAGPIGLVRESPDALRSAAWADGELLAARLDVERAAAMGPLAELVAPELLAVRPRAAQAAVARRFFTELDGRGIVSEPLGTGGRSLLPLVLGELAIRGLADRILVAGAPGMAERTAADLRRAAGLRLEVAGSASDGALHADRVVLDHDLAEAELEALLARPWDVVVVDAAHHVAGDDAGHVRSALSQVVASARWVLLLTPAPAGDDLIELRRLVELVRPGTFRPEVEFRARLVDPDVPHTPSRPDELQRLLAPVLLRSPASGATAERRRLLEQHEVELGDEAQQVMAQAIALTGGLLSGPAGWSSRRLLVPCISDPGPTMARAAAAAAEVAPGGEARAALVALADAARSLEDDGPRRRLLVTLVRLWGAEHGRVVVAARTDESAAAWWAVLEGADLAPRLLVEGQPHADRADAVTGFRDDAAAVIVASDAALAQVRLHPASALVCADLPWDPVELDDRMVALGDGDDELAVATFVAAGTVDATVAEVFAEQVGLFGRSAGRAADLLAELDVATGPAAGGGEAPLSFADRLVAALTEDPDDVGEALEDLADDLEAAHRRLRVLVEASDRLDRWLEQDPAVTDSTADREDQAPPTRGARLSAALARWVRARGGQAVEGPRGVIEAEGLLDGTTRRFAFDRGARDAHPDVELAAMGSPALADLLAEVRSELPVVATVCEPVDLPTVGAGDHTSSTTLVDRMLEPPTSWSATTTWRVRSGATEESVVEVRSGTPPLGHVGRRALDRGEPLPVEAPSPDELVEHVVLAAQEQLAPAAEQLASAARTAAEADRARLLVHHHAAVDAARVLIEESVPGTPEHERATQQLRSLHAEQPAGADLEVDQVAGRLRAEPVALQVDVGDDVVVVERWRHDDGVEAEVRYPWTPDGRARRTSEVSGAVLEVLALCHDGHVVDEAELIRCPSCAEQGCEACGLARSLASCPTCGTEVCGRCRTSDDRFGPCRGCRMPRREHELDTAAALGWRLGGEATLLVGARWAELRRSPDDDPVVLVPDGDVDDPVRRRLRAAADAAGLPVDVGADSRDRGPRPLPDPHDAWVASVEGASWKLEEGRGAEVRASLEDFDGPDGPEPLVEAEGSWALGELLERLRGEEAPPAAAAFVRTPHVDLDRTTVTSEGLVRTVDRLGADGSIERLLEEDAALVAPTDLSGHLFRSVVAAELGAVHLELTRLHRSTVVRLTTPTGTTECFAGAEDESTFGGELAWASWAEEEGLAEGAVLLVEPDRPRIEEEDLASPATVRLEDRSVLGVWGAEPLGAERRADLEPVTDDDLVLVGYDVVPDLQMVGPDERRRDLVRSLHERSVEHDPVEAHPHRLAHRWFEVEETWAGRSTVHLSYKVGPGEPAWPRLDDTHQRAADFEVDDHGHLHEPESGWRCLACGEHHCRACGPVGAMDACGSCGQPACGLCRARAARQVPVEQCDRCGASSCDDCGRLPRTRPCATCHRSVCARCRGAGDGADGDLASCEACAHLRPALEEEVGGLPEVLAAHGLHVELGQHGGEVSVLLLGAWRTEVAILRSGEVAWWVHHDDRDPATRRLLLAAARRWDLAGDLEPVVTGWSSPPTVDGPGLLLVSEELPEVRWSVEADGTVLAGSPTPPRSPGTGDVARAHGVLDGVASAVADVVVEQLEGPEAGVLAPEPFPWPTSESDAVAGPVATRRRRLELRPAGRLLVEDRRRASATWLTPDGLERVVSEGDEDRRTAAPWQVGVRFSWMVDGWEPTPEVVAYALLGEIEAALVRVGRHLALGVRGDDRVLWWTLRDEPGDLQRTLLGEHLTGEERVLDLRVVTDPGKVEGPTVVGATFIDRRIEPVLEDVGDGEGDPDEALRAAAAWVRRTAAAPAATGPDLDADLQAALVARADELSPPTLEPVGIALQVVETWRQGLDAFPVPYRLSPGTTVGTVVCVDTQQTGRVVHRDRSGHLVARVLVCPACGEGSCDRCHVRVQPCAVCGSAVCGACALDDGRCQVCASLVLVDKKEAKRLGLKVGRRATVLRAAVGPRTVLAVRDGDWSVTVEEAGAKGEPPPDDARPALLDRIASNPAPPGAGLPVEAAAGPGSAHPEDVPADAPAAAPPS